MYKNNSRDSCNLIGCRPKSATILILTVSSNGKKTSRPAID